MSWIVWAATRDDGCVGYFKVREDIPVEFKYPGEEDVEHVARAFRLGNIDDVLRRMNSHWQNPNN